MPTKLNALASSNGTIKVSTAAASPRDIATFHQRADALCRSAIECCRQHERLAKLGGSGAMNAEVRTAREFVSVADEALAAMAAAYETAATRDCARTDSACWQAANALWLASREYARRARTSTRAGRDLGDGKHSTERLAELTVDYDLEASALLQLRHAAEQYRRVRPQATAAA